MDPGTKIAFRINFEPISALGLLGHMLPACFSSGQFQQKWNWEESNNPLCKDAFDVSFSIV